MTTMTLSETDAYVRKYKLDYILQDARVDDLAEQQLLREEVINRVMSFRGRARIDHEKKLKLQRKAMITSFDENLKSHSQARKESLTKDLVSKVSKTLVDLIVDEKSSQLCNDRDLVRSMARCKAQVQQEATLYYQQKKLAAIQSMREEARKIEFSVCDLKSLSANHVTEEKQEIPDSASLETLKQELESRIDSALATDLESLLSRVPQKAQRAVREVIELQHQNLQIAAKIAILKSMLSDS